MAVYKCTTFKGAGEDFGDLTCTLPLCFPSHHPSYHANTSTDNAVDLVIWTSIEANSVIISACIPMLLPVVELIFGENFLNGGDQMRSLRTFRTYPKQSYGNIPHDGAVEMEAGARGRED